MPVLNGLHAAERIKRQFPNIKILCVTVTSEPEVIEEALNLGLDGYSIETCAPIELLNAIRFALNGKRYVSSAPLAERFCNTRTRQVGRTGN